MRLLPALVVLVLADAPAAQEEALRSRAERSDYEETSRYEDVMRFVNELARRSERVRVETFGRTEEGRALLLLVFADPPVATPREAMSSGKAVVFVFANIHGGEVEGKEALQEVARRIAFGDLKALLERLVILLAPIYNADGNDRISVDNRAAQNGPVGGVGRRENAAGLDLNRDYMKMEAVETQAMVRLLNRWDPHLTVDLHTTNGSYHGYHLTYSIPLNPNIDARLLAYHRVKMMPEIARAVLERHHFRTYYYGNFSGPKNNRSWRAFDHRPRIGQNYVGFRNRLTILSEAYSYLDFRRRIAVTTALVEESFRFAAAHGDEIRRLTQQADEDTVRRGLGPPVPMGIDFEMRPLAQPVEILVGEVTKQKNPRSGRDMTVMVEDKFTPVRMPDYGIFAATRSIPAARAYLFHPEPGIRHALDKLLAHGLVVEELAEPASIEVESFVIDSVKRAEREFQGHFEVRLPGHYTKETMEFPAGTVLIRAAQPLGALAFYLLEPESDDGLAAWNFLDPYLETGKTYPVYRTMQELKVSSRLLAPGGR